MLRRFKLVNLTFVLMRRRKDVLNRSVLLAYMNELYINVCRGVYNIYGGASLQKSQESFIVDV